ncbi:hypothetical protein A2U01_0086888, partial [Trifolium medium]|nr:hypothetical protein [Trifolium medium]
VRQPPPKRQREEPVIDVDALEKPYPLPRCFGSRDFMEKLLVLNDEQGSSTREVEKLKARN